MLVKFAWERCETELHGIFLSALSQMSERQISTLSVSFLQNHLLNHLLHAQIGWWFCGLQIFHMQTCQIWHICLHTIHYFFCKITDRFYCVAPLTCWYTVMQQMKVYIIYTPTCWYNIIADEDDRELTLRMHSSDRINM